MPPRIWPYVRRACGAAAVGTSGGVCYAYNNDEGFRRACYYLWRAVPIVLDYRRCELLDNRSESFAALHEKYADDVFGIVLAARGYYVKLAQAAYSMPACPQPYAQRFSALIDDAPHEDFDTVLRPILERELGVENIDDVFEDFSKEPLASASIGQVHSATLKDSGRPVVVKIQYTDAERNFNIDMNLFLYTAKLLTPGFVSILEKLKDNFANEFDYVKEARLQKLAHDGIQDFHSSHGRVLVPRPFLHDHPGLPAAFRAGADPELRDGMCTKNVLVMDVLKGQSVSRWGDDQLAEAARKHGYASAQSLKERLKDFTVDEIVEKLGKPPARLTMGLLLKLMAARNFVWNWSVAFPANAVCRLAGYPGARIPVAQQHSNPNIYEVCDLIYEAEGHLLFAHGLANGDPHPGNVMLLDGGGIGLIDWGQLRCLSREKRVRLARLLCAVAARDEEATAGFYHEVGFRTKRNNRWIANKSANFVVGCLSDPYATQELGGMAKFDENIERVDPIVNFGADGDIFIAMRMCMLLSLTSRTLGLMQVNSSKMFEPMARRVLVEARDASLEQIVPGRALPEVDKPDISCIKT